MSPTARLAEFDQPGLLPWAMAIAERGRRRLLWGVRVRLSLMVLVAVAAVALAPLDGEVRWSALAAAMGLLVAVFTDVALLQLNPERDWREGQGITDAVESLGNVENGEALLPVPDSYPGPRSRRHRAASFAADMPAIRPKTAPFSTDVDPV